MNEMGETRTNKYEATCHECGGPVPAGTGILWWQAGPDDGGDVSGRTPAGWRVSHRDEAQCQAYRAQQAAAAGSDKAAKREALIRWLREAPAMHIAETIDETDGTGNPVPRKVYSLDGVTATWVKRNYPSLPVFYRHTADGRFEFLGNYNG